MSCHLKSSLVAGSLAVPGVGIIPASQLANGMWRLRNPKLIEMQSLLTSFKLDWFGKWETVAHYTTVWFQPIWITNMWCAICVYAFSFENTELYWILSILQINPGRWKTPETCLPRFLLMHFRVWWIVALLVTFCLAQASLKHEES